MAGNLILSVVFLPTHEIPNLSILYLSGDSAGLWLASGPVSIVLSAAVFLIALKTNKQPRRIPILTSVITGIGIWVFFLITTAYSYVDDATIIPLAMWIAWLFFHPKPIGHARAPRFFTLVIAILLGIGIYGTVVSIANRVESELEWKTACLKYLDERETLVEELRSAQESNDPEAWHKIGNSYSKNLEFKYLLLSETATGAQPNLPSDRATGWTIEYAMYRLVDFKQGYEPITGDPTQKQWELWLELSKTQEFRDIIKNATTQKSLCKK